MKYVSSSVYHLFTGSLKNPALRSHIGILTIFFFFNVLLLTADIGTDIATAVSFFNDDHIWWSIFTLVPIFAPWIVRICIDVSNLLKIHLEKNIPRYEFQEQEVLRNLIWQFPLLHPIKYIYFLSNMMKPNECDQKAKNYE